MDQIKLSCPHCGFAKEVEQEWIPSGENKISCPKCHQSFSFEKTFSLEPAPPGTGVSKMALLLVTFFLGGIGGHRFYQKKYALGVLYLLFFWTYIPSLVALVEFIVYAFKSEIELQRRYPVASSRAVVYAVIIPMFGIALIGILAAIAIPQYASYREKASNALVTSDIRACKQQAEALFAERMSFPTQAEDLHCQPSAGVSLFYLTFGFDEFQIIGYHADGKKAFLAASSSDGLTENSRQEIENQLGQRYSSLSQTQGFHFVE